MEKIIAKYKFEFFAVDTYKNYNKWPREEQRTIQDFLPKEGKNIFSPFCSLISLSLSKTKLT